MLTMYNPYAQYFETQIGGNLPAYKGYKRYQKGFGFFGKLLNFAMPLFKKALPVLANEAVTTGLNIGKDAAEGEPIKTSVKKQMRKMGSRLLKRASQHLDQTGSARRRRRRKSKRKTVKRLKGNTIKRAKLVRKKRSTKRPQLGGRRKKKRRRVFRSKFFARKLPSFLLNK